MLGPAPFDRSSGIVLVWNSGSDRCVRGETSGGKVSFRRDGVPWLKIDSNANFGCDGSPWLTNN